MESYRLVTSAGNDSDTGALSGTSPAEGGGADDLIYLSWLMPVISSILILIGVVGNTLVIYVIIKASKRTVTNYYIVNLATADILFLSICAPPTAVQYTGAAFVFGRFMCKIVFYLQMVTVQATCFLLMAMSVDRFQAIVRPLKSLRTRTLQTAVLVSVSIWLFALVIYTPLLVFYDIEYSDPVGQGAPDCVERWPSQAWDQFFVVASFVLAFSLPLVAIAACYSTMIRHLWQRVVPNDPLGVSADAASAQRQLRQTRKITWMVLAVVVVFAVCWFPIHVVNMWRRLDPDFPFSHGTFYLKTAGHVMSYTSSCVNPFIYAFLGENFRKSFRKAFPCCFKQAGRQRRESRGATTGSHAGTIGAVPSIKTAGATTNITETSNLGSRKSVTPSE